MKELLRCHSVSYAEGLQIALEGEGIRAVMLDEQAPGYLGFAGQVRLAVADDADYERAMAVIRKLEMPAGPRQTPRSWKIQRWGVLSGVVGFALLLGEANLAETTTGPVLAILVAAGVVLMVLGTTLVLLGPRRDRT